MNETIPIHALQARILECYSRRKPLSVVRYGDGEAIVLNGYNDISKLEYVFKRQLGELPSPKIVEAVRNNLVKAYMGADIIGVPITNRFMDDKESYWANAETILGIALGYDVLSHKEISNIDFHSNFLDTGFFDKLLTGLGTLCYISCRNLDEQLKARFNIQSIHSFIIAPEMKFTSGYTGKPHYPDQFHAISEWMKTIPIAGRICLVGAGFIGKIYNNWFRDQGGISIDVGSVFDSWAGKATRGQGRGMDVEDKTFML